MRRASRRDPEPVADRHAADRRCPDHRRGRPYRVCACLLDTELGDDVAQQADHPVRGDLEARDVEDLRADVAVQSDEAQVVGGEDPSHRVHCGAAGQREAELLFLVRGRDELVGVRLDADGDAHQNVLNDTRRAGDGVEALDLGHRVQHDVADAGLDGGGQLVDGFVVAVQGDSLGREVCVERDGEFAAAGIRPATGPPRRSSGRPRCTGMPWRRNARIRRRRTPRRSRGSATGSRPRRSRTRVCRTRRQCR